jgi:Domain of unknown function (DUF4878)
MKKIIPAFFVAAAITLLAIGCKSKGGAVANDPRAVLVSFFERLAKKDIEGAAELATKDSKGVMMMMKTGMDMMEKMKDNPLMKDNASMKQNDPMDEFKNLEIGDAKINGDEATVAFKNKKKNEAFDFPLKKEDGGWKVDFSMATLMKMGMQEGAKNGDMNRDFNSIPLDSLQNGMKQIDSLMKTIDPEKLKKLKEAMEKMKQN